MSWITFILSFALIISISVNIFMLWFIFKSLQQIRFYDDELTEVVRAMKTFANHLKGVYEMEMFYGDETLRHLMRHAAEIIRVFDGYDLFSDEEEEIYDDTTQEEAAY